MFVPARLFAVTPSSDERSGREKFASQTGGTVHDLGKDSENWSQNTPFNSLFQRKNEYLTVFGSSDEFPLARLSTSAIRP